LKFYLFPHTYFFLKIKSCCNLSRLLTTKWKNGKIGFYIERAIEQIAIVLKALLTLGKKEQDQNDNFEMQLNKFFLHFFQTKADQIEKIDLDRLSLFIKKMGSNEMELLLLKTSKLYLEKNNYQLSYKYFELYKWLEQRQNRYFQLGDNTIEKEINILYKELNIVFKK